MTTNIPIYIFAHLNKCGDIVEPDENLHLSMMENTDDLHLVSREMYEDFKDEIHASVRTFNNMFIVVSTAVSDYMESTSCPESYFIMYWSFSDLKTRLHSFAQILGCPSIRVLGGHSLIRWFTKCREVELRRMLRIVASPYLGSGSNIARNVIDWSYLCYDHKQLAFVSSEKSVINERPYLELVENVLNNGHSRPDRTGTGTRGMFGPQLRFDISTHVPLLTTKYVPWKAVVKELLWFVRGQTDSKILEDQGVNIWKANTTSEFQAERGLSGYEEGDLGPMYGHTLRSFGAPYQGCRTSHLGLGFDQLDNLVTSLKSDPFSRRHLLTTFDPSVTDQCVLYPCHGISTQFYVELNERGEMELSCHTYCRSQDLFLGTPFNILTYTILTYILAVKCDMKPKELIISMGDAHIYSNHVDQARLMLDRDPLPSPQLLIDSRVKNARWEHIELEDIMVRGYMYHPSIRAPMAT